MLRRRPSQPRRLLCRCLREQVSEDPRIILSTSDEFYLCTRTAATPDMDSTKALLLMKERVVKYLFVPVIRPWHMLIILNRLQTEWDSSRLPIPTCTPWPTGPLEQPLPMTTSLPEADLFGGARNVNRVSSGPSGRGVISDQNRPASNPATIANAARNAIRAASVFSDERLAAIVI